MHQHAVQSMGANVPIALNKHLELVLPMEMRLQCCMGRLLNQRSRWGKNRVFARLQPFGLVEMLSHLGQLPPLGRTMGAGSYGNHRILLSIEGISVSRVKASIKAAMSCGGLLPDRQMACASLSLGIQWKP